MTNIINPKVSVNLSKDSGGSIYGSSHIVPHPDSPEEQGNVFYISATFENFQTTFINANALPFTVNENITLAGTLTPERVRSIDLSVNGLLAFTLDQAPDDFLAIRDMSDEANEKPVVSFSGITTGDSGAESHSVKFNNAGDYLAIGIDGSDIVGVLDGSNSWARISDLPGLSLATSCFGVAWSPDDNYLVAATDDGIKIWETTGFTLQSEPSGGSVTSGFGVAFHPTQNICVVLTFTGSSHIVYDTSEIPWTVINDSLDVPEFLGYVIFRSDGNYVVFTGSGAGVDSNEAIAFRCSDSNPDNWDRLPIDISNAENDVFAGAWSPNGDRFALVDSGNTTSYFYNTVGIDDDQIEYSFSVSGEAGSFTTDGIVFYSNL